MLSIYNNIRNLKKRYNFAVIFKLKQNKINKVYDFLNDLNSEQRRAVTQIEGPTLVIAGAGSGKTRVLTYRIANLLREGKSPQNILALTFTNKAAKEMKNRIAGIVGESTARYLRMGTFHSIFAGILRYHADLIGYPSSYSIYDASDSKNIIKSIIKELKLDDKRYKVNNVAARISHAKNNLITANAYNSNERIMATDNSFGISEMGKIYSIYTKKCKDAGAMDFDDLLLQTNILLRDNPKILEAYRKRFKYILVDEYQDTNYSQYVIVRQLSKTHNNICAVGDDSQSIYAFRGAKIENILNFKRDYPNCVEIKLEQNYRSTQNIVEAANSIIEHNKGRIPKFIFSENEIGSKLNVVGLLTDAEEAFYVVSEIMKTKAGKQCNYSDFVVLYRTNAQSRQLEEVLRRRSVPYKIYGGLSFYQRKEIKDFISYLRLVVNNKEEEALKRIINYPKRGIGTTSIVKMQNLAKERGWSLWTIVENIERFRIGINSSTTAKIADFAEMINDFSERKDSELYELAMEIASRTGFLKEVMGNRTPEEISRHENVQELLNGIKEFSEQKDIEGNTLTLAHYLEDVALLTDFDQKNAEEDDFVSLMTVHSAKGLEFKYVFVVGLEDGLFPSAMSTDSAQALEEERRLFYVAITRAEKKVWLTFSSSRNRWGQQVSLPPSRFIREIDPRYLSLPNNLWEHNVRQDVEKRNITNRSAVKPERTKFSYRGNKMRNIQRKPSVLNYKLSFKADNPANIREGMRIEHQRFGTGIVRTMEGKGDKAKAMIEFDQVGQKQLLLKFARLKIIR